MLKIAEHWPAIQRVSSGDYSSPSYVSIVEKPPHGALTFRRAGLLIGEVILIIMILIILIITIMIIIIMIIIMVEISATALTLCRALDPLTAA